MAMFLILVVFLATKRNTQQHKKEGERMEMTYTDAVFGTMKYRHQWYKDEILRLFGKQWNIVIAAQAYTDEPIVEAEQKTYQYVKAHMESIQKEIETRFIIYVNDNIADIQEELREIHQITKAEELAGILTPKIFLFQKNGNAVLLLDCLWDEENGMAIQVYPDYEIADQDAFL